jgi:hypothetical protein
MHIDASVQCAVLVFPAKAGSHFCYGHRPSPVWQDFDVSLYSALAEIVAYLRCGQPTKAAQLLRARLNRRPSPRDESWLAASSSDKSRP